MKNMIIIAMVTVLAVSYAHAEPTPVPVSITTPDIVESKPVPGLTFQAFQQNRSWEGLVMPEIPRRFD